MIGLTRLIVFTCLISVNSIIARKSIITIARKRRILGARYINHQSRSIITILSANILVKIVHGRRIASVNDLITWSVHIIAFIWIGITICSSLNRGWTIPLVQSCLIKQLVRVLIHAWSNTQISADIRRENAIEKSIGSWVWRIHYHCLQKGAILGSRRLVANVNIYHWVVGVARKLVWKYKRLILSIHTIVLVVSFEFIETCIIISISKAWCNIWTWRIWASVS